MVARAPAAQATEPSSGPHPEWYYHPTAAPLLLTQYDLDAQRTLYLGQYGDRWLADRGRRTAHAAADIAPTALVAAVQHRDQQWSFVAADGTILRSATAVAVFDTSKAPPVAMVEVTATADTVLGVARGGQLWRTGDLGGSWQPVTATSRFADVAFAEGGMAVAFSVPEQHWISVDQGRSWAAAPVAPFGALLLSSRNGTVHAQGVLGRQRWQRSGESGRYEPTSTPEKIELPFAPPRGPSASAVLAKRAAIVGNDYVEIESAQHRGRGAWQLRRGPLRGPLSLAPLAQPRCDAVKLAGFSRWLWLACTASEARPGDGVELWSSADRGDSWQRAVRVGHASLKSVTLAVGAQGRLLIGGLCAEAKQGCAPAGIQYLEQAGSTALKHSAVPGLAGSAEQLLFRPDGKIAYAIGRSNKNDQLGLFVSHDGGVSFDPRTVNGVAVRREGSLGITAASAADDDTITVAFSALPGSAARLLWIDAQGRVLALSAAPKERATVGIHGSRAIAIDRDGSGVWESRNAGASWVEQPKLPGAVCIPSARSSDCLVEIACAAAGCVFAESLTRLGWGSADAHSAVSAVSTASSPVEPRRGQIACRVSDSEWQRLALATSPPTADQSALGGYSWFTVAEDPSTTEVALWRAARERAAPVEKRLLLSALGEPARSAYLASLQVEGVAAIRYRVPDRVGADIGRVEVAWEDLVHGTSRSAVLDAGPYSHGDSAKVGDGVERAVPALVSISEGGIYLQIHGESVRDQPTFFLDGRRQSRIPELRWPGDLKGARGELLHVGQSHQPILFLGSSAVVRAAPHASSWTFLAHSVGWPDADRFGTDQELALGYWQGRPALHLAWSDRATASGTAVVLPFLEQGAVLGEPLVVPTQADLPTAPQPCSAQAIAETPRVVAQPQWGTRHVVNVSDAVGTSTLLTSAAVLHGTKQRPCVAAFEAEMLSDRRDELLSAIVELDAPEHAWLFRQARDAALEYRRMTCDVDASTTRQ